MAAFEVQITVSGRVGPALRSALAGLDPVLTPRHSVVHLGPGGVDEVVRLLRAFEERDVELDRIVSSTCCTRGG